MWWSKPGQKAETMPNRHVLIAFVLGCGIVCSGTTYSSFISLPALNCVMKCQRCCFSLQHGSLWPRTVVGSHVKQNRPLQHLSLNMNGKKHNMDEFDVNPALGGSGDYPVQPHYPQPAEGVVDCYIRYIVEGGKVRDANDTAGKMVREGRLVRFLLPSDEAAQCGGATLIEIDSRGLIAYAQVLLKEGVDLESFRPFVYDQVCVHFHSSESLIYGATYTAVQPVAFDHQSLMGMSQITGGWASLQNGMTFDYVKSFPRRVDIKLVPGWDKAISKPQQIQDAGFFTIGVLGLRHSPNLGTLWRSAYQLGAAGLFMIGAKFDKTSADVTNTWTNVPLTEYDEWNDFAKSIPYSSQIVAVEMGGVPLDSFEHPQRAVYLLGSEDNGIPSPILKMCHQHVTLPCVSIFDNHAFTPRNPWFSTDGILAYGYESFNVAVAGSILMYDRLVKSMRLKPGKKERNPKEKNSEEQQS